MQDRRGAHSMKLADALARYPFLLAEGSVVERLRRMPGIALDPLLEHAALFYEPRGARELEAIYRGYLDVARASGLPMLCFTPTWRASADRLARAGFERRDVNGDAVRFLSRIRAASGAAAGRILIGGLAGCAGDAYRPGQALDEESARRYHQPQAEALAAAGVDFLAAATLPAASEAAGLAAAMSRTGLPYLVSFIVDRAGNLLAGTPLARAIDSIDQRISPAPFGYMLNCVHPSVCEAALSRLPPPFLNRVIGFQANTSARAPSELDGLAVLETEEPTKLSDEMHQIRRKFGLRILGGCCGTDHLHIQALARGFPQP